MRLWRKISIYFIYPVSFMAAGFFMNMKLTDFFYPQKNEVEHIQDEVSSMEAVSRMEAVISADTRFVVKKFDLADSSRREGTEEIPEKYIGMDREAFLEAMEDYEESPSLEDRNLGFLSMNVESFSADEVVIQKNYESSEKCTEFYLAVENNYIVVYEVDKKTKYMSTGIPLQSVSEKLAREIMEFKYIGSEAELYNFLESYSS